MVAQWSPIGCWLVVVTFGGLVTSPWFCYRVFAGQGWGGGMLTFLVLAPLHVATLHRCLVVLHLCIHCRNGSQCWKVDTWVAIARVGCHEGVGLGGAC